MKHLLLLLSVVLLMGCQNQNKKDGQEKLSESTKPVQEKTFVELGGEKQYVEMTGASDRFTCYCCFCMADQVGLRLRT
jgi:proline iminopeptidase